MATIHVSASSVKPVADYLLFAGYPSDALERLLGEPLEVLEETDARFSITVLHQIWQHAIAYTNNPGLGLEIGYKSNPDDMGLVGHIFFNSETLGEALKQYERYYALVNESIYVELKREGDLMRLEYACDDSSYYCIPDMDRTLASSISRIKNFLEGELRLEYIAFQHPEPKYSSDYSKLFPCPVQFSNERTVVAFRADYLSFSLPKRSPYLHSVLSGYVENLFHRVKSRQSLHSKVKKLVEERLSKDVIDADHIAHELNMSRHTLYRKLKAEGIAFHDLVDEIRQDRAMKYLAEEEYSLSQIAFLLGYSELSAFSRAFKRWTGVSPAQFKKNQSNQT